MLIPDTCDDSRQYTGQVLQCRESICIAASPSVSCRAGAGTHSHTKLSEGLVHRLYC
uniref:Uncharacterized protein n=1 Tax=Anguilla anguilla TaxID=7936 RepID=A0A0E9RN53_ANGAN